MSNRVTLKAIYVILEDETQVPIDIHKAILVDRLTKKPLFEETIDA